MECSDILAAMLESSRTGHFVFFRDMDKGDHANVAPPGEGRSMFGPHRHQSMDMVYRLEGDPLMFADGSWREFPAGEVWVFPPGTEHGEGYRSPDTGYAILWIATGPQMTGFHSSVYDATRRDRGGGIRWVGETPVSLQLWELSQEPGLVHDPAEQAHFQALFMEAVYFMLRNPDSWRVSTASFHAAVVHQVQHYIDMNYWRDLTLDELAGMVRYSPGHLNTLFRRRLGMPVHQYLLAARLKAAEPLLKRRDLPIGRIASRLGFRDPLYFSRLFRRRFGISPKQYRDR